MRVALFCDEYPPRQHGGIGTFVHTHAHALTQRGHEATVIELGEQAGVRQDGLVKIITLPRRTMPSAAWYLNRRAILRYLESAAAKGEIDIAEFPEFQGMLPFHSRCPVVLRLHLSATSINRAAGLPVSRGLRYCERATLRRHPDWMGVSNFALKLIGQDFPGVRPDRQTVIYCPSVIEQPIEPRSFALPGRFVLFVGSVSRRKGAITLAQAARQILERFPDLYLLYVGAVAPQELSIAEEIGGILGESSKAHCHFAGPLTHAEVLACMGRAEMLVFPSKLETLGLVAIEAMQMGCPVVLSDAAPFNEFVENDRTGLLVNPDDPSKIAAAMQRLLSDAPLRTQLTEAARQTADQMFSVDRAVEQSVAFYQKCLSGQSTDHSMSNGFRHSMVRALRAISPRGENFLRGRLTLYGRAHRLVEQRTELRVASGPFAGMGYLPEACGSRLLPKLVGSYEAELHPALMRLIADPRIHMVVDVGCAEGYYAVGLALKMPETVVHAFDLDEGARRACGALAAHNGVANRVLVSGGCDPKVLNEILKPNALLICDCEGYEKDLLLPDAVPGLAQTHIIVELHDCFVPEVTQTIVARFGATHEIELLTPTARRVSDYPLLAGLPADVANYAIDEDRTIGGKAVEQTWAIMTPRTVPK